jgi:hypothetical protein
MKTRDEKLSDIEVKLKRWLARGMRAQTAINKLLKQQARLKKPTLAEKFAERDRRIAAAPDRLIEAKAELVQAVDDRLTQIIEGPKEDDAFDIPPELNRADPLIAERMTAARKKAEEEARHKMPLTGKAAMDHIRRKK